MIAWADEKFQTWILKKTSTKKTLTGMEKGKHELKMWLKHLVSFAIGSMLFWGIIRFVGTDSTEAIRGIWKTWSVVLLIDGAISLSYILFPKKAVS